MLGNDVGGPGDKAVMPPVPLPVLAAAVWAAWALAQGLRMAASWVPAVRVWAVAPWGETLTWGLLLVPVRHGAVLAVAALAALAFAGAGEAVRAWQSPARARGLERRAVGVLLGFAVLGAGFLGLALTGLFFPALLLAAVAAGAILPGARGLAARLARARLTRPAAGGAWLVLALAPAALPLLMTLVPDAHVDTYTYHLAIPEQFLKVHKFTAEGTSLAHQFPLTAELVYGIAVTTGQDALAHWLQLVPFAAGVALLVAWAAEAGGAAAGWLTLVLVATLGEVGNQAAVAKNDLAAAGFAVGGAILLARGRLAAGALLLGCGGAVKFNVMVLAAVAALLAIRRKGTAGALALAALPLAPWLAKTWLMVGDPLWPVLSAWWPGALWDPESARAVRSMRSGPPANAVAGAAAILGQWQCGLLAVLPPALYAGWRSGGGARWLAGFAILGSAALAAAMASEWARLALPAFLVAGALAAVFAAREWETVRSPRVRRALLAAGVLAGWFPLGHFAAAWTDPKTSARYLLGALSRREHLDLRLSTIRETAEAMRGLPGARRFAGMGDVRFYRFPGRYLADRCYGRTQAWVLAHECATTGRMRVRLRQMGCSYILYNFVTETFPHPFAEPFKWNDAMIARWRSFVGRDLEIAVQPRHVDHENGGFCIFGLRARPLASDPEYLLYLPGVESLYYEVSKWGPREDIGGWLRAALVLNRRIPNVDYISNLVAIAYYVMRDWPRTYRYLAPGIRHGMVDDQNWWNMAQAAAHLGRWGEAIRLLDRSVEISPFNTADAKVAYEMFRQVAEAQGGNR